jgi:hypothetical protein
VFPLRGTTAIEAKVVTLADGVPVRRSESSRLSTGGAHPERA